MKILQIITAALIVLSSSIFASPDTTPPKSFNPATTVWLNVTNTWTQNIYVTEGLLLRTTDTVRPSDFLKKVMIGADEIDDLRITYDDHGIKRLIPGCPAGTSYKSLNITVLRSNWDANTPTCNPF